MNIQIELYKETILYIISVLSPLPEKRSFQKAHHILYVPHHQTPSRRSFRSTEESSSPTPHQGAPRSGGAHRRPPRRRRRAGSKGPGLGAVLDQTGGEISPKGCGFGDAFVLGLGF